MMTSHRAVIGAVAAWFRRCWTSSTSPGETYARRWTGRPRADALSTTAATCSGSWGVGTHTAAPSRLPTATHRDTHLRRLLGALPGEVKQAHSAVVKPTPRARSVTRPKRLHRRWPRRCLSSACRQHSRTRRRLAEVATQHAQTTHVVAGRRKSRRATPTAARAAGVRISRAETSTLNTYRGTTPNYRPKRRRQTVAHRALA